MDQTATESPVPVTPAELAATEVPRSSLETAPPRSMAPDVALLLADVVVAGMLLAGATAWLGSGADWRDPWVRWAIDPLVALIAWTSAWVCALGYTGAYGRQGTRVDIVTRVARAALLVIAATCVVLFLLGDAQGDGAVLIAALGGQALAAISLRWLQASNVARSTGHGGARWHVLLVGDGPEAQRWADRLAAHPELGVEVVGMVSDESGDRAPGAAAAGGGRAVLGRLPELPLILRQRLVDEIAVCVPPDHWARGSWAVTVARQAGKAVSIPLLQPELGLVGGHRMRLDSVEVVTLAAGVDHRLALAAKRAMDVAISAVGLLVLSPLLLSVALVLLVTQGRPVLFVQQRVGQHGRPFGTYKFRTMVRDAEARLAEVASLNWIHGPAIQLDDDPRVTRIGRWLRRTSIDELPQLINTLRGDMSIVGPRPAPLVEVAGYAAWHRRRLAAKPGITGLAQVTIRRYQDFDERARLDIRYIDEWWLGLDLWIILRTIPMVLGGSGR